VIERGFSTQNWLTFHQALNLSSNVRKGEHGTTVVYADRFIQATSVCEPSVTEMSPPQSHSSSGSRRSTLTSAKISPAN
jgi:N-terminal domain of anti-restriction factor ArdC